MKKFIKGEDGEWGNALPVMHITKKEVNNDAFWRSVMHHISSYKVDPELSTKICDSRKAVRGDITTSDIMSMIGMSREDLMKQGLPSTLKNYDFMSVIFATYLSGLSEETTNMMVRSIDELSTNAYVENMTQKIAEARQARINSAIEMVLAKEGLLDNVDPNNQEQMQALQQRQQEVESKYYIPNVVAENKDYRTLATEFLQQVFKSDVTRFNIDNIAKKTFEDMIAFGVSYRAILKVPGSYRVEYWDPAQVTTGDWCSYTPQGSDFIGRTDAVTINDMLAHLGDYLTDKETKELLRQFTPDRSVGQDVYEPTQVQKTMYAEYITGIPLTTTYNQQGTPIKQGFYNDLSYDADVQRLTCFFRGYKRKGIMYYNVDGEFKFETVTDEILPEFLTAHGIKTTTTKSLEEFIEDPTENTLIWTTVPVIYQGHMYTVPTKDASYYYLIEELEAQPIINGNAKEVCLPVVQFRSEGIYEKIRPYAVLYNIGMNAIYLSVEKAMGQLNIIDINLLPTYLKEEFPKSSDGLVEMLQYVKSTGFLPIDSSQSNLTEGAMSYNPFTTLESDNTRMINISIQLAQLARRMAFEVCGLTDGQVYGPHKQLQNGIDVSTELKYAVSSQYYEDYDVAKELFYNIHISYVHQLAADGNVDYMAYSKGELSQEYLKVTDPSFPLYLFSIQATSSSTERMNLERIKQYLLSTNTINLSVEQLIGLITADSILSAKSVAKAGEQLQQEAQQRQFQQTQELEAQRLEGEMATLDKKHAQEKELLAMRIEGDVIEAQIGANKAVYATNTEAETSRVTAFMQAGLKKQDQALASLINRAKLEGESAKGNIEQQKIALGYEKLATAERNKDKDLSIAVINPS